MPIEIREVLIKAQLEKKEYRSTEEQTISPDMIRDLKEEIMDDLLEKIEDRLWKKLKR